MAFRHKFIRASTKHRRRSTAFSSRAATSQPTQQILGAAKISLPDAPEALALARGKIGQRTVTLAAGSDAHGLVYALLELADRVNFSTDPLAVLKIDKPVSERPANAIRSISRGFNSDVEDKPWFQDREFWPPYLAMLAANRFNRFNLTLGLGYDFATGLRDTYFYFAYPFFLSVPGYDVRAVPLPDAERDLNLAMLKFISDEAAKRGLQFQLGLWTQAFTWTKQPGRELHHRRPHAGNAGRLLPRRLARVAHAMPQHHRRDAAHPRRKRRARRRHGNLENYFRRRRAMRAKGGN